MHARTALKTVLVLCGAAALAASAAFLTVRQSATYLSVSAETPPTSSVQQPGAKDVPMLGLRLQAYAQPVMVSSISFAVLTDRDGRFENGIADDVDPAQALEACTLLDASSARLSGPVAPSSASRTLTFALSLPLAPLQAAGLQVHCTLGAQTLPGPGSDQIALALLGPQDVQAMTGGSVLPVSAVSFGWFSSSINARGAVSVWRNRPAASKQAVASSVSPAAAPEAASVSVQALPLPARQYLLPREQGVEVARFRLGATQATTVRALTFVDCLGYQGGDNCLSDGQAAGNARFIAAAHLTFDDASGAPHRVSAVPDADGTLFFRDVSIPVATSATLSLSVDTSAFDPSLEGAAISYAFVDSGSFALTPARRIAASFASDGTSPGLFSTDDAVPGLNGVSSGTAAVFVKSRPAFSIASGGPDGSAPAAMGEVFRFTVSTQGAGAVDLYRLAFRLHATDRAKSGWTSCDQLATSAKWGLRDADDPGTRLEDPGDWIFYQEDGSPCVSGGTLAYAVVDFTRAGDPQPKAVGLDVPRTWLLRVDASGAASGDTLRVDIPAGPLPASIVSPVSWTDAWALKTLDASGLPGLPLSGGTLRF